MSEKTMWKLGIGVVALILIIIALVACFDVTNVDGNEVAVVYTYASGVTDEPKEPGLCMVFLGTMHKVNIGTQKITFSDNTDPALGPVGDHPSIVVNCGKDGGQKASISMTVNYSLQKNKVVPMYKEGIVYTYPDIVLKRTIIEVVNETSRPKEALDIFSGQGFNDLGLSVEKILKDHPMLADKGIEIQNAMIYNVDLDENYESQIAAKQLAKQKKLTEDEQTKASQAMVQRVKAEAQAEVEQRTAKAEAAKVEQVKAAEAAQQQVILKAEGDKQQVIAKAEADAKQVVLKAEAEKIQMENEGQGIKLRDIAKAEGVKAVGLAEALVEDAKKKAMYDGEAGVLRAQVEIANYRAMIAAKLVSFPNIMTENAIMNIGSGLFAPLTIPTDAVRVNK
jgi:regulator of protease activity HflC (stomatin/prohibitin superfamily)